MEENLFFSKVTPREKEVVQLLAEGLNTIQIGQKLNISDTTVITHRNNLRKKLGCKNCAELIYKATRYNLI
jgi:DNA-binding NarL/FixJ family response regulator